MIDRERLAQTFSRLVRIDSVSKEEKAISKVLCDILTSMGADVAQDDAGNKIGGQTGNIIAKFQGNVAVQPMLLNAHMDTVEPGRGVEPVLENGVFSSKGDTILGADDKSALAVILEVLWIIKEHSLPHGPLEVVFTVSEEIGLLGAKNLNFDMVSAKYGFALDATDPQGIITRAPSANHLVFTVHGKAAHAGAKPENGINAIQIAGRAIADMKLGRIDHETTCNIGTINGGLAINIVPERVRVEGEARSHDEEKLNEVTTAMVEAFQKAVADQYDRNPDEDLPLLEHTVEKEFTRTHLPENHPVVSLAMQAAKNLKRVMACKSTGGGADANVFTQHGIDLGVIGTGMKDMHTVKESVKLDDMVATAELLLEIVRLHAQGNPA
ncbi:MAG: M20/M25/M40 family metallo-hydrolase [Deltaproteobacteria bacterium]|jgi:tripeptide aminopeptidase|nr:M20/M25/M40 family metallo-hydrolase [Deltaproteobacteria bacterium]